MDDPKPAFVEPDTQTPKVLGILNVIFGLGLMVCFSCLSFYMMTPVLVGQIGRVEAQRVEREKRERQTALAEMKKQEAAAQDPAEKARLKSQREELAALPEPKLEATGMESIHWNNPSYLIHVFSDLLSSLFLNLLMIVSGIGLLALKGWARALAAWVAGLKIARLCFVAASLFVVVAPFAERIFGDLQALAEKQAAAQNGQAPAPAAAQERKYIGLIVGGYAVGLVVFGSIYPALSLWLLNRPAVRAACCGAKSHAVDEWRTGP